MDSPLEVRTCNEGRYYLMVTACDACREGVWEMDVTETSPGAQGLVVAEAHCTDCGRIRTFSFRCEADSLQQDEPDERINPTDQPSRIVDLAQWLGLFHMLLEQAASAADKAVTRRSGYRAALCLAEALKFYGDDELPDASALFTDQTLATFREHPEKFARRRLRAMQAKLPALPEMVRRIACDAQAAKKRWWQFWR